MARSGIYKSEVKKARDALLAQGRTTSIDAVRAELGNTGSKTTIHRYLKELEEEEGAGFGRSVAVSEALQDLVGRLAERLHEEAEARITELRAGHSQQLAQRDEMIAAQKMEIEGLSTQLQRTEMALQTERSAHEQIRQTLNEATILCAQLGQQVASNKERLAENETHRQSLEAKHQHAQAALEHYRQSVKEQREQEQRRHEQQTQQLQAELRTLNQTLIVKQNELTQAYQDAARTGAELVATRKELLRSEVDREKEGKARNELQQRVIQLEASVATLTERLQQRNEVWQLLKGQAKLDPQKDSALGQDQAGLDALTMDLFAAGKTLDPS